MRVLFVAVMCLLAAGCLTASGAEASTREVSKSLKIVIVGDSTVANYPLTVPDRGWGQFMGEYFKEGAVVVNLAKNGRSSKSFIKEGLWEKAKAERPDYVLIQFGHNDSHAAGRPEATDAGTDFREYLRKYVDDARGIGAVPVLVTPMQRRTYGAEGKLNNTLLPYAEGMKVVGKEKGVAVIDLNAMSGALYERLGEKANAAVSRNGVDTTHFNERGARWMAELVMGEFLREEPGLKGWAKKEGKGVGEIELGNK